VRIILSLMAMMVLSGCAGMNPNPGERTTDVAWENGNYTQAFEVAEQFAEQSHPWAELRLGMYYDVGHGVEENIDKSLYWYKRAANHNIEGKWAEGYIAGAAGKAGYFGERNDALIAQYRLARLYMEDERVERNLVISYILATQLLTKLAGSDMFFCCEWSEGRFFTTVMVEDTIKELEEQLTEDERRKISEVESTWTLTDL
jgi:TPR repeat protein